MGRRAELVDETRQRIVDAAVHLHGTVGPAATTIAAIAEHAGVTRLTVYRHFADEEAPFNACSAHWLSQQTPPDPQAWAQIADPAGRLTAGLADIYRFYSEGHAMITNIYRDKATLPAAHQARLDDRDRQMCQILQAPLPAGSRIARALIGHAVSFWTWRSLCVDQGLDQDHAVRAMTTLILGVDG